MGLSGLEGIGDSGDDLGDECGEAECLTDESSLNTLTGKVEIRSSGRPVAALPPVELVGELRGVSSLSELLLTLDVSISSVDDSAADSGAILSVASFELSLSENEGRLSLTEDSPSDSSGFALLTSSSRHRAALRERRRSGMR